jgi:hypothetical protein
VNNQVRCRVKRFDLLTVEAAISSFREPRAIETGIDHASVEESPTRDLIPSSPVSGGGSPSARARGLYWLIVNRVGHDPKEL